MKKIVPVIGSPGERVTRSRKARLMEAAEGQNADLEAARRRVGEILRGENTDADDVIHELLPLVYDQLRGLARRQMKAERVDHTLQATALVNEAFCRLVGDRKIPWDGPAHFYAAAAEAMRR
ncbi:MAG: ECF-type sigma factor, partial [Planctomycetota bacterium]